MPYLEFLDDLEVTSPRGNGEVPGHHEPQLQQLLLDAVPAAATIATFLPFTASAATATSAAAVCSGDAAPAAAVAAVVTAAAVTSDGAAAYAQSTAAVRGTLRPQQWQLQ